MDRAQLSILRGWRSFCGSKEFILGYIDTTIEVMVGDIKLQIYTSGQRKLLGGMELRFLGQLNYKLITAKNRHLNCVM